MSETKHLTRRRVIALLAVTLAFAALAVTVRVLSGPPAPLLSAGDKETTGFADEILPDRLNVIADGSEGDRVSAVTAALQHREGSLSNLYPFAFTVTGTNGSTVSIASYYYSRTSGFSENFWGGPYWGRACRIYDVQPSTIRIETVECGPDISETPEPGEGAL